MDLLLSLFDFIFDPTTILLTVISLLFITSIISLYLADRIQKNADVRNEFVTIISHKFRTPLTSVRWNIETMMSSEKDPEHIAMIKDMQASNQLLINLTNTLIELTLTKKESKQSYNLEPLSLYEIVTQALAEARQKFDEKHIVLTFGCSEENKNLKISADKDRIAFVIGSLLKNALTYTPEGGSVEIDIIKRGKRAEISVTDSGIGIEKIQLDTIFSEFHRAPNAQSFNTEGLGVDLYLVKSIMDKLGATIRVFSEGKDRGAKFTASFKRI